MPDVVLVNMPFAALERPSLALSLLKAILHREGISAEVRYPNLEVGELLGAHTYRMLDRLSLIDHILEWTFTPVAFPEHEIPEETFLPFIQLLPDHLLPSIEPRKGRAGVWQKLRRLRFEATGIVDGIAPSILADKPKIVGCTSTFQQHVASLALLSSAKLSIIHMSRARV